MPPPNKNSTVQLSWISYIPGLSLVCSIPHSVWTLASINKQARRSGEEVKPFSLAVSKEGSCTSPKTAGIHNSLLPLIALLEAERSRAEQPDRDGPAKQLRKPVK